LTVSPPIFDRNVQALDVAGFIQATTNGGHI
jgi:hypothetical protein